MELLESVKDDLCSFLVILFFVKILEILLIRFATFFFERERAERQLSLELKSYFHNPWFCI
jgi:hypothetical protein